MLIMLNNGLLHLKQILLKGAFGFNKETSNTNKDTNKDSDKEKETTDDKTGEDSKTDKQ